MSGGNLEPLGEKSKTASKKSQNILAVIKNNQILDDKLNSEEHVPPDKYKNDVFKPVPSTPSLNINTLSVLHILGNQSTQPGQLIALNNSFQNPVENQKDSSLGKKLFGTIYVQFQKETPHAQICLIDSGADVSVIYLSLLIKMIGKEETFKIMQPSTVSHLGGFANGTVKVIGDVSLWCRFSLDHSNQVFVFHVTDENIYFDFLFGADNMRRNHMSISYKPEPQVCIDQPQPFILPIIYCLMENLYKAVGHIDLAANQMDVFAIRIKVNNVFPEGANLLISQDNEDQLNVIPTRNKKKGNILMVFIENPNNFRIRRDVIFECEEISNNFEIVNPGELSPDTTVINRVQRLHEGQPTTEPYLELDEDFSAEDHQPVQQLRCNLISKINNQEVNSSSKENPTFNNTEVIDLNTIDASQVSEVEEDLYEPLPSKDRAFGYSVQEFAPIEEILNLSSHPVDVQPYLRELILGKYPEIVSRSPFDIGQVSYLTGLYKIQLKEGAVLPKFKRLYYTSGADRKSLDDVLQFLVKYDVIAKIKPDDPISEFASPAYLVPKPNKQVPARLIIDYKLLNDCIETNPPTLPDAQVILHSLHNYAIFTQQDLTSAYYSVTLDPESRYLTKFATPSGNFYFKSLPQGVSSAPSAFGEIGDRILNYEVVRDEHGKIIFDAPNVARMKYSPLEGVFLYYDDVVCATPPYETYEKTIEKHFELVDKVLYRLHLHKAKISLEKAVWARTKILYLGWVVSHNRISVDPKRVNALLEAPIFTCKKGARSWLGLLNTLKSLLPTDFIQEISVLTPLTSSSKPFKLEPIHYETFEKLKKKLLTTPIFSNMVDPNSPKYLWTDSAEGAHAYEGAVLTQVKQYKNQLPYLPSYLDLDNPVDAYIYDKQLDYQPARFYINDNFDTKISERYKKVDYLTHPYLGFSQDQFLNSLFICIHSIQKEYNCHTTPIPDLRKAFIKDLKSKITGIQMRSFSFNNDFQAYKNYLEAFVKGEVTLDKQLYILEVVHRVLKRKTVFIKATKESPRTITYGADYNNPEFVFGMFETENGIAFRPYFIKRYKNFDLKSLKDNLQIIGFFSKPIPLQESKLTIKELEINALLDALAHFRKILGGSDITALNDNQSLVLIFSSKLRKMYPKFERWSNLLRYEWPHLKVHQISGKTNLSDFLTRDFEIKMCELKRIPVKYFDPSQFSDLLEDQVLTTEKFFELVQANEDRLLKINDPNLKPIINLIHQKRSCAFIEKEIIGKTFTIEELYDFTQQNEHKILRAYNIKPIVNAISRLTKDIEPLVKPLTILQKRMSHPNIQIEQRIYLDDIYNQCLSQPGFKYVQDNLTYILKNGLIFVETKNDISRKLYLPESLEYLFISYYHCATSHAGYNKLMAMLEPYYIPLLSTKLRKFLRACYSCYLTHANSYSHKIGSFPQASSPLSTLHMDLAEDLPPSGHFKHCLVAACPLTTFIIAYPLRTKTSEEIAFVFANSIYPYFNPKTIVTDGGPGFRSNFSELLSTLNIHQPQIARYHPQSNGTGESNIRRIKQALTKILIKNPNYKWHNKLFIITKMMNSVVQPKLGYSPFQLLYGTGPHTHSLFDIEAIAEERLPTNTKIEYLEQVKTIKTILEKAKIAALDHDHTLKERLNKNKCAPVFNVGDYCFVKDRRIVLGVNPSLRPKFSQDIWVVIATQFSTVVLNRIADGIQNIFAKEDIKLYRAHDPNKHIPAELKEVLSIDVTQYDRAKFELLRKYAKFDAPDLAYPINNVDIDGTDLQEPDNANFFDPNREEQEATEEVNNKNQTVSPSSAAASISPQNLTPLIKNNDQDNLAPLIKNNDQDNLAPHIKNNDQDNFAPLIQKGDKNDLTPPIKNDQNKNKSKADNIEDNNDKVDLLVDNNLPIQIENKDLEDEIQAKGKSPLLKKQKEDLKNKNKHRYNTRSKPNLSPPESDSDSDNDKIGNTGDKRVRFSEN